MLSVKIGRKYTGKSENVKKKGRKEREKKAIQICSHPNFLIQVNKKSLTAIPVQSGYV
jgi:hypothetical protein